MSSCSPASSSPKYIHGSYGQRGQEKVRGQIKKSQVKGQSGSKEQVERRTHLKESLHVTCVLMLNDPSPPGSTSWWL